MKDWQKKQERNIRDFLLMLIIIMGIVALLGGCQKEVEPTPEPMSRYEAELRVLKRTVAQIEILLMTRGQVPQEKWPEMFKMWEEYHEIAIDRVQEGMSEWDMELYKEEPTPVPLLRIPKLPTKKNPDMIEKMWGGKTK